MNEERKPYVIVMGGGKVGFALGRHLTERGYEVTLLEKDASRADWITHQLGVSIVMVGDGDEMAFLATTGIERAGVFVAATGDDDDNLVACQLAKAKFSVPRTIARVSDPANVKVFSALGIDVPLSATALLMVLIEAELSSSGAVKGIAVKASGANLVDVALRASSAIVGRRIGEVILPEGELVVCIVRGGRAVVPTPDTLIAAEDELIIYSQTLDVESVRDLVAG